MPFHLVFISNRENNFTSKGEGANIENVNYKVKMMNATQFEAKGEQLQNVNVIGY